MYDLKGSQPTSLDFEVNLYVTYLAKYLQPF